VADTNKPLPGGTYEYEDGESYLVYAISTHAITGEIMVVYESLNDPSNVKHCSIDQFMESGKFTLVKHPSHIPMD